MNLQYSIMVSCVTKHPTDDVLRMLNDPELQNAVEKIPKTRVYEHTSFTQRGNRCPIGATIMLE